MTIDGKAIREELLDQLKHDLATLGRRLSLMVFVPHKVPVVERFVEVKRKVAQSIGVEFAVEEISPFDNGEAFIHKILAAGRQHDGIVIQLPLGRYEPEMIRQIMPITHDVDVFGTTAFSQFKEGRLPILPPVVGAIQEIMTRHRLSFAGKRVVVVGQGRLVGIPSVIYAKRMGAAEVVALERTSEDIAHETEAADILILGAGAPGVVRPEMIREGVAIFDAGTSEEHGKLMGDADPACAEKASLFTPVPGGIGPITVAMIFKNLYTLMHNRSDLPDTTLR